MFNSQIQAYIKQLKEYNNHTNLYSKSAYDKLDFHTQDSINIANIISNTPRTVMDWGSGSGFPSIIIAITNPKNTVFAVESKTKKCQFLQEAKNTLNLPNYHIKNMDLNQLIREGGAKADIFTAKAFAPYDQLQKYLMKTTTKKTNLIVPISKMQHQTLKNKANTTFIINPPHYYLIMQNPA